MFNFWKQLFAFAFLPLYFGGSGGSSASTTTTNNTSTQAGIGDGAIGVFGSNNTMNMLDGGAIGQAFGFGRAALDANSTDYGRLLETTSGAFDKMLAFGRDTQKGAAALVDTANSKGGFDNKTMMILGGGALLVVAAVFLKGRA